MDNFALQGLITQSRLSLKCDCRVPISRRGNTLESLCVSPHEWPVYHLGAWSPQWTLFV